MDGIAHEAQAGLDTPVTAGQITQFLHLGEVFRILVYRGPNGNHQGNSHLVQFFHHGFRVWPVHRVEFPFALFGPVEKVDDNLVNGQIPPLILSGDVQQFFLGLIAQLTLPEAKTIFRHSGYRAGDGCVAGNQFLGGVSCNHPVVQGLGCVGFQGGGVLAEHCPTDCRVVPQKTIAPGGNQKRHTGLGAAVGQFQICAFQIEKVLLILAHSVQFFLRVQGFKPGGEVIIPAR